MMLEKMNKDYRCFLVTKSSISKSDHHWLDTKRDIVWFNYTLVTAHKIVIQFLLKGGIARVKLYLFFRLYSIFVELILMLLFRKIQIFRKKHCRTLITDMLLLTVENSLQTVLFSIRGYIRKETTDSFIMCTIWPEYADLCKQYLFIEVVFFRCEAHNAIDNISFRFIGGVDLRWLYWGLLAEQIGLIFMG
jgi:hypothetical protein